MRYTISITAASAVMLFAKPKCGHHAKPLVLVEVGNSENGSVQCLLVLLLNMTQLEDSTLLNRRKVVLHQLGVRRLLALLPRLPLRHQLAALQLEEHQQRQRLQLHLLQLVQVLVRPPLRNRNHPDHRRQLRSPLLLVPSQLLHPKRQRRSQLEVLPICSITVNPVAHQVLVVHRVQVVVHLSLQAVGQVQLDQVPALARAVPM